MQRDNDNPFLPTDQHQRGAPRGLPPRAVLDEMTFPEQLMRVLFDESLSDIITWLPHGRGWIILDRKRFSEEVLPYYFGSSKAKYGSFTRKLNRWNFLRAASGDEIGAYYHPLFLRDRKELCSQMVCGQQVAQPPPLNTMALGLATPNMIEQGFLSGIAAAASSPFTSSNSGSNTINQARGATASSQVLNIAAQSSSLGVSRDNTAQDATAKLQAFLQAQLQERQVGSPVDSRPILQPESSARKTQATSSFNPAKPQQDFAQLYHNYKVALQQGGGQQQQDRTRVHQQTQQQPQQGRAGITSSAGTTRHATAPDLTMIHALSILEDIGTNDLSSMLSRMREVQARQILLRQELLRSNQQRAIASSNPAAATAAISNHPPHYQSSPSIQEAKAITPAPRLKNDLEHYCASDASINSDVFDSFDDGTTDSRLLAPNTPSDKKYSPLPSKNQKEDVVRLQQPSVMEAGRSPRRENQSQLEWSDFNNTHSGYLNNRDKDTSLAEEKNGGIEAVSTSFPRIDEKNSTKSK